MKCKICGEPINFSVFGMPDDICYGCLRGTKKEEVLNNNVKYSWKDCNGCNNCEGN